MTFKKEMRVRAHELQPTDVILGKIWLEVLAIEQHRNLKPKRVTLTLTDGANSFRAITPWDRRCLIERVCPETPTSPSRASEIQGGVTAPPETLPASPEAVETVEERVARLLVETRERYIAEVRKIIRENP